MTLNTVGREIEQKKLIKTLKSTEAEFIAVYGRRRVGKTHLIKNVINQLKYVSFECTGLKDGTLKDQLLIFTRSFEKAFVPPYPISAPTSWIDAFDMLNKAIALQPKNNPIVIFFDALPWLATPKSGLMQALDHFWNVEWATQSNVKLIACGSAASWMIDNLINAEGGLHNRLTQIIQLKPFTIKETKAFLEHRNIKLSHKQILDIYMVVGGIPFYLKALDKGYSAVQNIDELCFTANGLLFKEFDRLYASLFKNSEAYIEIIRAIASRRKGIEQEKLLEKLKLSSSGGTFSKRLKELEEAGFILGFVPYGSDKKGIYYRIIDEYTLFYLRWIEPVANRIKLATTQSHYWQSKFQSQAWKSWSGYAFEAFCYKHIDQINKALNIHVGFDIGTWRYLPKNQQDKGTEVDLLLDRDDGVINLIEIKHSEKLIRITKQYATLSRRIIDKKNEIIMKIKTASKVTVKKSDKKKLAEIEKKSKIKRKIKKKDVKLQKCKNIVSIGISTGEPQALTQILPTIP